MSKKNKCAEFFKNHYWALIGFVLLALVFTFPLIGKINTEIPQGRGDTFQAISNIDLRVAAVNQTQGVGHKLFFLAKNINTYLPYVVLNLVFNKYVSYNLMFFLSFILSGIGMYFLVLCFVENKTAAFLSGLIFAFAPFHFYEATVVNLGTMHQEWLPFFALFMFKFFENFKLKNFFGLIFFAFMIAMTEHQFLAFTILFLAVFVIYRLVEDPSLIRNKKLWLYAGGFVLLLVIAAFGMFGQLLSIATSGNNFLDAGMNAANKYSMGFLDPLAPPAFHGLWPGFDSALQKLITGDDGVRVSYFFGFSVMLILGWFGWTNYQKNKKKKIKLPKGSIRFWIISSIVFYLFSLGPSFTIGKMTIYLPYFLVYKFLPFYENIRTTGRMFVFVLLGISVLFAFAYVEFSKKYSRFRWKLPLAIGLIILLEFWAAPMKTMSVSYSPFYDKIAADGQKYKLIEIPGSTSYEFASYELFLSTIHKKEVLNGMPLARKISKEFAMQQSTPILKQLLYTIPKGNDPDKKNTSDIVDPFDYAKTNELLNYYGAHWITISKQYANKNVQKLAENFVDLHIKTTDRYEDQYLVAYQVAPVQPIGYFDIIDNDNGQFSNFITDKTTGESYRVMGNGANLKIVNMSSVAQKITVQATAKQSTNPLLLSISNGAQKSENFELGANSNQFSFDTIILPGDNLITFNVTDQAGKAIKMSNSKAARQGAIVSHIQILAK